MCECGLLLFVVGGNIVCFVLVLVVGKMEIDEVIEIFDGVLVDG